MADSPNSTILSRRNALGAAGAALALASFASKPIDAMAAQSLDAELLLLNQRWLEAKAVHLENCDEEIRLFDLAQEAMPPIPPGLTVRCRSTGESRMMSERDIQNFGCIRPKSWADAKREELQKHLQARQEVCDRIGQTAAEQAVTRSYECYDKIEDAILELPAHTVEGILVKLSVVRDKTMHEHEGEWWNTLFETAYQDLQRLAAVQS